jgi:hypothetical protein
MNKEQGTGVQGAIIEIKEKTTAKSNRTEGSQSSKKSQDTSFFRLRGKNSPFGV